MLTYVLGITLLKVIRSILHRGLLRDFNTLVVIVDTQDGGQVGSLFLTYLVTLPFLICRANQSLESTMEDTDLELFWPTSQALGLKILLCYP